MSIGKRVEGRRIELGMSQAQLTKKVGLAQPTISALESGKSVGTNFTARLAAELQVHALWLETGVGARLLSEHAPEVLSAEQRELLIYSSS